MYELKRILTHKRGLQSFIKQCQIDFSIEELDMLITHLIQLNDQRKAEIEKEQALQEFAIQVAKELKESDINIFELIQFLREQSE